MAKKGKVHNIRDIFLNTNLLEGAAISQSAEDNTFRIKGFTIIKAGLSANGNYYSEAVLEDAGKRGVFDSKTIRTDHPEVTRPQSVRDIVGKVERTWYSREGKALMGDGFFSSTADDLITKVNEGLVGDLSINARGITEIEKYSGDKLRRNVKEITQGYSLDLVCEAAAGGSLHEDFQRNKELCERMKKRMEELEKLTLEELKEARPDLIQKLTEEVANSTSIKEAEEAAKKEAEEAAKKDGPKPVTAEEVKTLVTEAVGDIFKGRDKAFAEITNKQLLSEGITKAVTEVLGECGASDSVKLFVERAILPYATENFKTLDSVDKVKLSEERDRILKDFDVLAKEYVKTPLTVKAGGAPGKGKKKIIELLVS